MKITKFSTTKIWSYTVQLVLHWVMFSPSAENYQCSNSILFPIGWQSVTQSQWGGFSNIAHSLQFTLTSSPVFQRSNMYLSWCLASVIIYLVKSLQFISSVLSVLLNLQSTCWIVPTLGNSVKLELDLPMVVISYWECPPTQWNVKYQNQ